MLYCCFITIVIVNFPLWCYCSLWVTHQRHIICSFYSCFLVLFLNLIILFKRPQKRGACAGCATPRSPSAQPHAHVQLYQVHAHALWKWRYCFYEWIKIQASKFSPIVYSKQSLMNDWTSRHWTVIEISVSYHYCLMTGCQSSFHGLKYDYELKVNNSYNVSFNSEKLG